MKRINCLVLVLLFGLGVESVEAKKRSQNKASQSKPAKPKRGQFVIAPIPISSPAVGSGLVRDEKSVLAYRGVICSANQSVPFYDLCLFGTGGDIRGYTGGEFQNRRMFAGQAEYRRQLF